MRVAAIYDIHGNLPALAAVLADIRRAGVDQVVVGSDVLPSTSRWSSAATPTCSSIAGSAACEW
jgi:hypothetical protein